ncbi:hypothetical protein YPPY06_3213, partial [Yersinia pestis PY-06]
MLIQIYSPKPTRDRR